MVPYRAAHPMVSEIERRTWGDVIPTLGKDSTLQFFLLQGPASSIIPLIGYHSYAEASGAEDRCARTTTSAHGMI